MPDWLGTVVDPLCAVVVTTGIDEGVVTETVATGVVALTVVVGTVVGTVAVTVGALVGTDVDWVVGTVGTVGTVVGTVVGNGGTVVGTVTVTVVPSGRAVASTFATKKPDAAKQTSNTIIRHFTTFISPSEKTASTQQELLAPPASLVNSRDARPAPDAA